MVIRESILVACVLLMMPQPSWSQTSPDFTVGVRPSRVRVGDTFVLTVRLSGGEWPEVLDVDSLPGGEVVDVQDRSSTALGGRTASLVLERDFIIRALRPGNVAPATVYAIWGVDTVRIQAPAVQAVGSPVAWADGNATARRRRDEAAIRDQGLPPTANGRDADRQRSPQGLMPPMGLAVPPDRTGWLGGAYSPASPQGGYVPGYPWSGSSAYPPGSAYPGTGYPGSPYTSGAYPGAPFGQGSWYNPYAPTGWGMAPPGRGWAPSAAGDPWWPELVPQLERYETMAEDPTGLLRLEAGLTPQRVYVGQQVTLVATATFAPEALARLGSSPEFFPPSAGDAWAVEIPYAPPTPAAVGGRVQEAHTFMRAFFPVAEGRLRVEPARLRYATGTGGVASRPQEELATEAMAAEVMPIPERGAPPGWSGAVGRYRIAAWVQPNMVSWGEAALLTVEIAGAGNLRSLARPDPGPVWGAELRPTGERAFVEVRDGVVGGVKTFSWLVVPVEPGPLRIGPVIFSFFDPWIGGFGQVASEEVLLEARAFPAAGGTLPMDSPATVRAPWKPGAGPGSTVDRPSAPTGVGAARGATVPDATTGAFDGSVPPAEEPETASVPSQPLPSVPAMVVRGAEAAGPARSGHAPEAEVHALLLSLDTNPRDGDAWLALARAYDSGRPGEGWREWGLLSGVRNAPRHRGLREALREEPALTRTRASGVPLIPLTAGESVILASLLGAAGAGLVVMALRGVGTGHRRARLGVATMVLAAAAVTLEPWHVLHDPSSFGVAVEGPVQLRTAPAWSAERTRSVTSGTPLRLGERYGNWIRVEGGEALGWAEISQVVPLGTL